MFLPKEKIKLGTPERAIAQSLQWGAWSTSPLATKHRAGLHPGAEIWSAVGRFRPPLDGDGSGGECVGAVAKGGGGRRRVERWGVCKAHWWMEGKAGWPGAV